jgi:23S rRNA (pseudouridine1915-N3)-methyltransferase
MKLRLLAVGTRAPDWVQSGFGEYARRMPEKLRVQVIEIPLGSRLKNQSVAKAIGSESQALLKTVNSKDFVVALDIMGKSLSTQQLALQLQHWQSNGRDICFMIGGPDGLSANCLARADMKWSLSSLTLPHMLVRVLLMEQLYRAWAINANHPYHRI